MIQVTRLNGKQFIINALLIETMEETPDTLIILTTGKKIIVLEKVSVVVSLVQNYIHNLGIIRAVINSQDMEERRNV